MPTLKGNIGQAAFPLWVYLANICLIWILAMSWKPYAYASVDHLKVSQRLSLNTIHSEKITNIVNLSTREKLHSQELFILYNKTGNYVYCINQHIKWSCVLYLKCIHNGRGGGNHTASKIISFSFFFTAVPFILIPQSLLFIQPTNT
jgi:hypothetical protein